MCRQAIAQVMHRDPMRSLRSDSLKHDEPYIVWLRQPGEVRRSLGDTAVWIDQFNGEVLAARDALQVQPGDAFLAWQFPLHNGEAFGLIGRIAVYVAGIIPALLYISGIFIWWKSAKDDLGRHSSESSRK